MMGRAPWILLVLAIIGVIVLSNVAIPRYAARDTIRGIDKESFLRATGDILSPSSTHFSQSNLSVKDITYVDDKTALVSVITRREGVTVYIVFELNDGHIYLTNYASTPFSVNDFAVDSDTAQRIINIADGI